MDDSKMIDEDPERFQVARDGDHMMVPFQCDTCQFMNIQKRLPRSGNAQDELLLKCLRHVILDSFWSRERSTVQGNWNLIRNSMAEGRAMGLGGEVLPTLGPFPPGGSIWGSHCLYHDGTLVKAGEECQNHSIRNVAKNSFGSC